MDIIVVIKKLNQMSYAERTFFLVSNNKLNYSRLDTTNRVVGIESGSSQMNRRGSGGIQGIGHAMRCTSLVQFSFSVFQLHPPERSTPNSAPKNITLLPLAVPYPRNQGHNFTFPLLKMFVSLRNTSLYSYHLLRTSPPIQIHLLSTSH